MRYYRRSIHYSRQIITTLILAWSLVQTSGDAATQNNTTSQLPLPTKTGEVFLVDDFNNKVTRH